MAVIPRGDDALLSPRWKRHTTVTVRGTNVALAEEAGFHCRTSGAAGTQCWPPNDPSYGCYPPTGRSPDQADNYCAPLWLNPDDADPVEAWQQSAEQLRQDLNGRIDALIERGNEPNAPRWSEADRQIHAANMRGYRQAVYLARTIVGSQDPVLGAQIDAAGTAALDVYEALTAFRNLPDGASENLAAIALTGNFVSVGFALAGALMDPATGPSEGEIILGEIEKLQSQVNELRDEMHDRFDGIHEHLDDVYARMSVDLEQLLTGDERLLASVVAGFANSHAQMTELGRVQLDTQRMLIERIDALREEMRALFLAVGGCNRVVPDEEWQSKFGTCLDIIRTRYTTLPGDQLPRPNSTNTVDEWLRAAPDNTIAWSFAEFKRLLSQTSADGATRAVALPESVVGPEAWFAVMNLHDGFLVKHPDLAGPELPRVIGSQFSDAMSRWRSDLVRFGEAIREEWRVYQDGSRPTVFSTLLAEALSGRRLENLLLQVFGDPVRMLWDCLAPGGQAACEALESLRSSTHVRDVLLRSDEFTRLQRERRIAVTNLRHWATLAFRDAIGRSEAITAIVEERAVDVDLEEMVETADVGFASWGELIAEVDRVTMALEDVLRSADVATEASSEFEHEFLTEFAFPSLGDVPIEPLF